MQGPTGICTSSIHGQSDNEPGKSLSNSQDLGSVTDYELKNVNSPKNNYVRGMRVRDKSTYYRNLISQWESELSTGSNRTKLLVSGQKRHNVRWLYEDEKSEVRNFHYKFRFTGVILYGAQYDHRKFKPGENPCHWPQKPFTALLQSYLFGPHLTFCTIIFRPYLSSSPSFISPLFPCSCSLFYCANWTLSHNFLTALFKGPPPLLCLSFSLCSPPASLLCLLGGPSSNTPSAAFHRQWERFQTLQKHSRPPLAAARRATELRPQLPPGLSTRLKRCQGELWLGRNCNAAATKSVWWQGESNCGSQGAEW